MNLDIDIETLVKDRNAFNNFVYMPLNEALVEIKRRSADKGLEKKILAYLENDLPPAFKSGFRAVMCRNAATLNYEISRFVNIVDALEWDPVIVEYNDDKFTLNNTSKYFLGRMGFHFGFGKKGGVKTKFRNIIEFTKNDGQKIKEVRTLWGQPLMDFHHELFFERYPHLKKEILFDASEWFRRHGDNAKEYYKKLLALFIQNGILFENFLLEKDQKEEFKFTNDYFLPAFIEVSKKIGVKPLIVALEPTDIEGDFFWLYNPADVLKKVDMKLNKQ